MNKFLTTCLILALALALRPVQRASANTYTVNSTSDEHDGSCSDGDCSLRDAIIIANTNPGVDTIEFNIPGAGVHTLQPTSALPSLTGGGTTLNGYSQPGASPATASVAAVILIHIDGTNAGASATGLQITSANNRIRGLAIYLFNWNGIAIGYSSASGNILDGNYLGTDGTHAYGNGRSGVFVGLGATNNTVGGDTPAERNVLSGNGWAGVEIHGAETTGNIVSGNYIGAGASGAIGFGNTLDGVWIYGGAHDNTVGGNTSPGERNVIASNQRSGVRIVGGGTTGNVVMGNYIGTDKTGGITLSNAKDGVYIGDGAQSNTIGGNSAGERNVIAGNLENEVRIYGTATLTNTIHNTISGNFIGLNAAGTAALAKGNGVQIANGAQYNTVGGDATVERNAIIGNTAYYGVVITGSATMSNTVSGNTIGTDATGSVGRLVDGVGGVLIGSGAQHNTIGGDAEGERNIISGNSIGVRITGANANTVSGNYIGTDATGVADLGNTWAGVYLDSGAQNNLIGGSTSPGERNVISCNQSFGIFITDSGTNSNKVSGNYIGPDASGSAAIAIGVNQIGIRISDGAQNNLIGGTSPGERNVISGNEYSGVEIQDVGTNGNVISGNYIGTDASGVVALENHGDGVSIVSGAQNNVVGGDTDSERNIISGNTYYGVYLYDVDTSGNTVSGNYIGVDVSGAVALGNGDEGVYISSGAHDNVIGGDTPAERNVISGNEYGVAIEGANNNFISGNTIGTDASGTADLGNLLYGVVLWSGAGHNVIGGDTAGERNVISGNDQIGVVLDGSGTTDNVVSGNTIGLDASGTVVLGNTFHGVVIRSGAHHNTIGGGTPGERNVISGNGNYGVGIWDEGTDYNTLMGNYFGTDASGVAGLGSGFVGVQITSGAERNWVLGGIITHYAIDGVNVSGSATTGNNVSEVRIFDNGGLGINLESGANGDIMAPGIVTVTLEAGSVVVRGKACIGCIVEIFANPTNDGEGQAFLGHTVADGLGHFEFTTSVPPYPYLTATARDATDGTSEFSGVFTFTVKSLFLPIVIKN